MNRTMVAGIFSSAAGLFGAVSVAYLHTWYGSGDPARAQTAAFMTWLLGHVLLALNMRSDREPLVKIGLLSNRLMTVWAAATVAFVMVTALIPGVRTLVKTAPLSGAEWGMIVGLAVVGTCWLEVWKLLGGTVRRTSAPAAPQPG
jgi:Ca2+-transporting ATPase